MGAGNHFTVLIKYEISFHSHLPMQRACNKNGHNVRAEK